MSALVDLRTAIVLALETEVTGATEVESYGGRLNLDEVNRVTKRTPAVLVAVVNGGSADGRANGQLELKAQIAAFVLTEDARGNDRDAAALSVAEEVIISVAGWSWKGAGKAKMPKDVKLESLYSGKLDRRGVALLAVSWTQIVPIGRDRFEVEREGLPDHLNPDGLTIMGALDGAPIPPGQAGGDHA